MAFVHRDNHLIRRIEQGEMTETRLDEILAMYDRMESPTKDVLPYVSDIAALMRERGLQGQYGLFGGYAVLAQLTNRFGDGVVPIWRGSKDIDMFGSREVANVVRAHYKVHRDRQCPNIVNKGTLDLSLKDLEVADAVHMDYMLGEDYPYRETEEVELLGVPVTTVKPFHLVRSKIDAACASTHHYTDIVSLLGVLEYRGQDPSALATQFGTEEGSKLKDLIAQHETSRRRPRFALGASGSYLRSLRNALK